MAVRNIPTKSDRFKADHKPAHVIEPGVAEITATGRIADYCYDCDDYVTRISNDVPTGAINPKYF